MNLKKGSWNPDQALNLDEFKSELLDDKVSKNIVKDLRS